MSKVNERKKDHIKAFSFDHDIDRNGNYFTQMHLKHRALPEIDFDSVDTNILFLRKSISFPFIISSMTGGSSAELSKINQNLAMAAEHVGVAMAVGSQRVMLKNEDAVQSFQLRKYAPNVPIIANIGAIQLNNGVDKNTLKSIISSIDADALYLHLNPLQECIQPEGNRNFLHLADRIAEVCDYLDVPVLVKEIGCGFSEKDMQLLQQAGVRWLDVAGKGGTSWSRVENHRRHEDDLGLIFQDWGIPTPHVLRMANELFPNFNLIASGGIRNGIDMLKAIILGARLCASAAPLLQPATESSDAVINSLEQFQLQLKTAMFLCSVQTIEQARNNSNLLLS